MDSNRYGWYYAKTNMPIWILLTPGRWWAELEFHMAGNGRLFLSGRRRRSVVWHILYTLLFYVLIVGGLFFLIGGAFFSGRQATPAPVHAPQAVHDSPNPEARGQDESETVVAIPSYEEVMAPPAEEAPYVEDAAPELPVEKTPPATTAEKAEAGAADDLKDLY